MKILIGALSGWKHTDRRERCRATWFPDAAKFGHEAVFLIGVPQAADYERVGDYLILPCQDDYATLTQKTRMFCQYALKRSDWTWLFKCDDDTFVSVKRLEEFAANMAESEHWYVGNEPEPRAGYCSGGAGYFLNRRAAERVADGLTVMTDAEDLEVGKVLCPRVQLWICPHFMPQGSESRRPLPGNHVITAHAMSSELWVDSHKQLAEATCNP